MAHYAFLDEKNMVIDVITGKDQSEDGIDWETEYGKFRGAPCKKTSYNTYGNQHLLGGVPFRGNYAGIGYTYNETLDAFIPPQPFYSWTLNTNTFLWEAPVAKPNDGKMYLWVELNQEWVERK